MGEPEAGAMESLADESKGISIATVHRIAHHWESQPSHVDSNLVGSPGVELNFDEGVVVIENIFHLIVGNGRLPARHHSHADPV